MAIDDNASYELTGYQVKDLAGKIRAKADSSSLASVATSGLYSDLTGAPTIPTVYNGTLTIQQNGTQLGTFSANQSSNTTINITGGGGSSTTTYYIAQGVFDTASSTRYSIYSDSQLTQAVDMTTFTNAYLSGPVLIIEVGNIGFAQVFSVVGWVENAGDDPSQPIEPFFTAVTYEKSVDIEWYSTTQVDVKAVSNLIDFTGATASIAGKNGLVPAPAAGDEGKALHGDGTWKDTTAKLVEMSYGEANAWTKFLNAYNAGSIVYCRASSNANPATGSQTRKAFMAYVNDASSPTSVEFQYVRSVSSKTSSQPVDQVFVYTLKNTNGGTWSVDSRDMAPKIAAGTGISVSYNNGTYTISLEQKGESWLLMTTQVMN